MESYKHKSRMYTLIAALISGISIISVEQWQTLLGPKYSVFGPVIVSIIAFLLAQLTEEKRVTVAEDLVHLEYARPSEEAEC